MINKLKNKINYISIKRINLILFFLMFSGILVFIFLNDPKVSVYFILLYTFILFLFIFFNYLYSKEFEESKQNIKNIIKNNENNLIRNRNFYSELNESNNLFNNLLLNKNLLRKDYDDLERVLFTFTSEYFLDQISQKGRERIELGVSIEKEIHVMFLDIIGFTTITERLKPERALLLLNIYFDGIVEIIKKYNGFVDKFLGDGILAIFTDKETDNTIKASIEIQDFIKNFRISEIGRNIYVGIGINSGKIIMGTIGSKKRMEVTIIGDVVNTASRIEGFTRKFKEKIIISEESLKLIKNKDSINIKDLGEKVLKGKKIKKRIYGITKKDNK